MSRCFKTRGRVNTAGGILHKGSSLETAGWRYSTRGWSGQHVNEYVPVFEDIVGELEFSDVADELFNLLICYAGDGRHITEPPVVLRHAIADSTSNAEVGVVARFVDPVDEGRAGC